MTDKQKTSSVRSLSHLFTFLLVIIVLGIAGALFFALRTLPTYASSVNDKLTQANLITPTSTDPTQASEATLKLRASKYFSSRDTMESQLSRDVATYSKLAGIPAPTISSDPQNATLSLSFANPVPYKKFIQFLSALEANVPKMTVTNLNLKQSNDTPETVMVENIKLTVAVR